MGYTQVGYTQVVLYNFFKNTLLQNTDDCNFGYNIEKSISSLLHNSQVIKEIIFSDYQLIYDNFSVIVTVVLYIGRWDEHFMKIGGSNIGLPEKKIHRIQHCMYV